MAHPILMPSAGQSMTEGKIVVWLKNEGDPVEKGEPLLEIETDKANLEVEALQSGVLLKILHEAGETCPVLALIGVVGEAGEEIDLDAIRATVATTETTSAGPADAAEPPPAPPAQSEPRADSTKDEPVRPPPQAGNGRPTVTPSTATASRMASSPAARRVAAERGVALAGLRGSGPGGRILRRDVENAGGGAGSSVAWPVETRKPYPPASPRPEARVELSGMRGAIARTLQQSKQTAPHFYGTIAVDMTAALAFKDAQQQNSGAKISVNDIVLRATVQALVDEPAMNCHVHDEHIEYPGDVNLGIAVGSEGGLVVPVILKAQKHALTTLATESRKVIDAARGGKLVGMGQGTFTVSNLGMFGVESFSAILNPPEGAILAVGAARPEVVPYAGGFMPRSILRLTISCDHRAIDGLLAARFLSRLRALLEDPARL